MPIQPRYAYKYAVLRSNGLCTATEDTTNYILRSDYVPVTDIDNINYLLKYYYPMPESVSSFSDFQGLWYYDEAHTQLFDEGNV